MQFKNGFKFFRNIYIVNNYKYSEMNNILKNIMYSIVIFVLISSNCLAQNDTKKFDGIINEIITIHEDNSAEVTISITYSNYYDEDIPFLPNMEFTKAINSFSNKPTYNYSVNFNNQNFNIVEENPKDYREFNFTEIITQIPDTGQFEHKVKFRVNFGKGKVRAHSFMPMFLNFRIDNYSFKEKSGNNIVLMSVSPNFNQEMTELVIYNSNRLTINLPNSPYIWSEYISSSLIPSTILSKGTSQSIFWDNYSSNGGFFLYTVNENEISKKISALIEQTNLITIQAQESGDIAFGLGILALILTFISIDYKILKSNLKEIEGKIVLRLYYHKKKELKKKNFKPRE